MRTLYATLLLTFSTSTLAFMGGSMQGMDMEKMAAKMEEMKTCMEKVDQKTIQSMQKRGQSMADEVQALCKKGDRNAAQKKAMSFAREIRDSKEITQIRDCGKIAGMQPRMPDELAAYKDSDTKDRHVCDN